MRRSFGLTPLPTWGMGFTGGQTRALSW